MTDRNILVRTPKEKCLLRSEAPKRGRIITMYRYVSTYLKALPEATEQSLVGLPRQMKGIMKQILVDQ
jgi:hypothetical protein